MRTIHHTQQGNPATTLRFLDLDLAKTAVLGSLRSQGSQPSSDTSVMVRTAGFH
jgi:hypothetical protein